MSSRAVSDRVAVVVGGSRGIGLVIARAMAGEGARVVIADAASARLERAAAALNREMGAGLAVPIETDVTKAASVRALARRSIREMGHVDVLINAASVLVQGIVGQTRCRDWMRMLDTNLLGAVRASTEYLPHMLGRHSGHIINVVPVGGFVPGDPATIGYDSGYSALIVFTHGLDRQVHGTGVNVSLYVVGATALAGAGRDSHARSAADRFTEALIDGLKRPRFLLLADPRDAVSMRRRWGEHELAGRLEVALRRH